MSIHKTAMCGWALAGLLLGTGSPAWAEPENHRQFQKHHPRQAEVLKRVDRERNRVNNLNKQGKISKQQRNQLDSQIHSVRKEDYADAKANSPNGTVRGGHITRGQQGVMNQQENQINREIGQDTGR